MRKLVAIAAAAAFAAFAGCQASDESPPSGRVRVLLTDAPLEGAVAVLVKVQGVELVPGTEGEARRIDLDREINLLDFRDGKTTLLGETDVEGRINQIRLHMDGSVRVVFEDGTEREALVPSGARSGIKVITGPIDPSEVEEITLDFDAAKSIHETGNGKLIMRPTIKAFAGGKQVGESEDPDPQADGGGLDPDPDPDPDPEPN